MENKNNICSSVKFKKSGKTQRLDFTMRDRDIDVPDLLSVQKNSYKKFLNVSLKRDFSDFFPVVNEKAGWACDVTDFNIFYDEVKYPFTECEFRGLNLEAPLKATVKLTDLNSGEIYEDIITIGMVPIMTEKGTFMINGTEKVVVNQIVRAPGCYYKCERTARGSLLFSGEVIPTRGTYINFEVTKNNVLYGILKINNSDKKFPITILLKILGLDSPFKLKEFFGNNELIENTLKKDKTTSVEEAYLELYRILVPQSVPNYENAKNYINQMFFNERRFALEEPGRYKYNKKLDLTNRIVGWKLAKDVRSLITGEVINSGQVITKEIAKEIQNSGQGVISISKNGVIAKVATNRMVDIDTFGEDYKDLSISGKVYYPEAIKYRHYREGKREEIIKKIVPLGITPDDIIASISYLLNLEMKMGKTDDIDHLSNRRIRCVGELMDNAFRMALSELCRNISLKMEEIDREKVIAKKLFNTHIIDSIFVKEFFNSSDKVSLFEQENPLSSVSHLRKIDATGKGGVDADRAGFEVRDINSSHYGKICPVETPEGKKIGLVLFLSAYAKLDEYGFITAPYRVIKRDINDEPIVTNEIVYLAADEDENFVIAQASEDLDENGHFVNDVVVCHKGEKIAEYNKKDIEYMDAIPNMIFGVSANIIPFLQNDDANRALMGSNMTKQAVPLLFPDSAVVSTGFEHNVVMDSNQCVKAEEDGRVKDVDSTMIIIENQKGEERKYELSKFKIGGGEAHSCINQRPNVFVGEEVKEGDVIADGPAIKNGELALGQNPLIGFMEWEGYNYEDAVLISERLVKEDVYTTLHIFSFETETREVPKTNSHNGGEEEITRNMEGYSNADTKDLDESGIIRIGAHVREGTVLVGKTTPLAKDERIEPQDKIINVVFGKKARKVKNVPLTVPHGMNGTVIATKRYSKDKGDELPNGVLERVVVYIAQKRKVSVGDKMAGKHGNKGIVSRIVPIEDMPYLENGRPLDIVLNPLGVPSRMNIGQVLELHLGLLSEVFGLKTITPTFNGIDESGIEELVDVANDYTSMSALEFEKKHKDLPKEFREKLLGDEDHRKKWAGIKIHKGCKLDVYDGRTGEKLPAPISVGYMHYFKLKHMIENKIHARSIGPYEVITQQPTKGKASMGGQRFGEMEVWALEAYGAASTLQEMMTIKSDDIAGRTKSYNAILKGEEVAASNVPESFSVLIKTLQGLGLNVNAYDESMNPIEFNAEIIDLKENKFIAEKYGFDFENKKYVKEGEEQCMSPGYHMIEGSTDGYEAIDCLFDDEEE